MKRQDTERAPEISPFVMKEYPPVCRNCDQSRVPTEEASAFRICGRGCLEHRFWLPRFLPFARIPNPGTNSLSHQISTKRRDRRHDCVKLSLPGIIHEFVKLGSWVFGTRPALSNIFGDRIKSSPRAVSIEGHRCIRPFSSSTSLSFSTPPASFWAVVCSRTASG